jgi:RNA polymerase sigma-70 factor (ECF subfamily)
MVETASRIRFDSFCKLFGTDVLRFVLWLCRDRALAEDVMQETLLRAWRSFDSLQDEQAAKPWLLTIARRELARVFERKRLDTVDIEALSEMDAGALAASDDEDVQEVRRAILQLDVGQREPLMMQVVFGYSTGEIAQHLNLGLPAVLTRLFRARQSLRRQLLS